MMIKLGTSIDDLIMAEINGFEVFVGKSYG